MKKFSGGRFARMVGAMGAAMLMVAAPTVAVGPGIGAPVAHAQDDEPVPVVTETETEVVTEEAPAPVPAPAPADEPVPVPGDDAVPVPQEEGAVADRSAMTTDAIEESTAPEMASRAMLATTPTCENPTIWISSADPNRPPSKAWELVPVPNSDNKEWVRSGLAYDLINNGGQQQYDFGAAIAMDQSNTFLWSAPSFLGSTTNLITLQWINVRTGERGWFQTGITPAEINRQAYLRTINSLSFAPDGNHLYVGAFNSPTVWTIDVTDTNPATNTGRATVSGVTGFGGDFLTLSNGGTLGATNDGSLIYWPGRPTGSGTNVGKVRGLNGTIPRIQGLAMIDNRVYLVDGQQQGVNTSTGFYRLPDNFVDNLTGGTIPYSSSTIHNAVTAGELFTPQFNDLTSHQDSFTCPPPAPTFAVNKKPAADQDPSVAGDQANAVIGAGGTTKSYYDVTITNNADVAATPADVLTPPPGFTVTGVTATLGGTTVATSSTGAFDIPADKIGEIPAGGSKTIRVEVSWQATPEAVDAIVVGGEGAVPYVCTSGTPPTTDGPRGLFNAVTLAGEDDPAGTTNNQACVTPVAAPVSVSKAPRPGDPVTANPDGTATLVYTVTVNNESDTMRAFTAAIEDEILLPPYVAAAGNATIEATAAQGVTIDGLVTSWNQTDIVGGARLPIASGVVLPPDGSQTFTITIPVKVTADSQQWTELAQCNKNSQGIFDTGGARNGVLMARDVTTADDIACIPIVRSALPSLTINKVDIDAQTSALSGAQFALYPAAPDGTFDSAATAVPGPTGTTPRWENLEPGKYYLVETQAPEGFQLLPQPVGITISAAATSYMIGVDDIDAAVAKPVIDMNGNGYELIVQVNDIKTGNLPLTGPRDQAFWYALALAVGLGMVLLNLGLFRREQ